jgi:magnesium chelatase subunit D
VGQGDLSLALLLNAVSPAVGGVLVRGEKGTAKSTAVRGLSRLLPQIQVADGCPYNCDPWAPDPDCPAGPHADGAPRRRRAAPLVELPVGASTDRVAGALDLERALTEGRRGFEPGLLAAAHRGILYVDEVNLLGDHLVDLLLDAAALGVNYVEREGVSVRHAARFLLVGTMNPEEGELRPQLLDRFGVTVEVRGNPDPAERVEVIRRRLAYEADPDAFASAWAGPDAALTGRIAAARTRLTGVRFDDELLQRIAAVCAAFAVDGLRGDIVTAKAALALAAWEGRDAVELADVRRAALLALPHRRRRGPMDPLGLDEDELDRILAGEDPEPPDPGSGGDHRSSSGADPAGARNGERQPARTPSGTRMSSGSRDGAGSPPPAPSSPGDGSGAAGEGADAGGADAPPPSAGGDSGERAGRGADGAGAAIQPAAAPGEPFTPIWLALAGTGAGAWGRRSPAETDQGQPVSDHPDRPPGAALALAATLRAAACMAAAHPSAPAGPPAAPAARPGGPGTSAAPAARPGGPGTSAAAEEAIRPGPSRPAPRLRVRVGDLRWQVREGREGNLVLFLVDASGSMAARRRMTATKGAVLSLLLDAYQRRDKVGLVSLRAAGAEVLLPPTSSVELAARRLASLPTGGRTPLEAGLARARRVLQAEAVRDPRRRPLLIAVTDGRANALGSAPARGPTARSPADPVGAALAEARALAGQGVASIVIDTEDAVVRLGLAAELARALRGPCIGLESLAAQPLAGLVRAITGPVVRSAGSGPSRRRRVA